MLSRVVLVLLIIVSAMLLSYHPKAESDRPKVERDQSRPQYFTAVASGLSPEVSSIANPPAGLRPPSGKDVPVKEIAEPDEGSEQEDEPKFHDQDASLATFSAVPMPTPSLSAD